MPFRDRSRNATSLVAIALAAMGVLAACGGSSTPSTSGPSATGPSATSASALQPAAVGDAQCEYGSAGGGTIYAQVAMTGTTCETAVSVASAAGSAKGTPYTLDNFSCSAMSEGAGSTWATAWGGTYYAYSCKDGAAQVAFTWGTDYVYGGSGSVQSNTTTTAGSVPSSNGALQPSALGQAQCDAGSASGGGSTYAQVAMTGTTCETAVSVAAAAGSAKGTSYTIDSFSCSATREGAGSTWADAWGGTYYAYSCKDGAAQVAFNWGTDYTY